MARLGVLMETPFLVGAQLYLRPMVLSDLEGAYVGWLNDAAVCKGNGHHVFPYTREQAEDYIQSVTQSQTDLVLAVVLEDGDQHIGNVSLQRIAPVHRCAEFAILVGESDHWGKGYGLEAALLIMRHGFDALNLHRIHCGTLAHNQGMLRLAAALGMAEEGRRREAHFKDGRYVDIVEFGVLRDEFLAKHGKQGS